MKHLLLQPETLQNQNLIVAKRANVMFRTDVIFILLLAGIVIALNWLWFSYDHHWPSQDEAEHLMNSMSLKDLLVHCRPFHYHWWYQCLTINKFYPPFAYLINSCFLILFGQSRYIAQASVLFFVALTVVSIYAIARLLSASARAALIASLLFCSYPIISTLSHTFLLDLPEIAMIAASIMTMLWWRSFPCPTLKNTLITSVILGGACLTKQLVVAYLLPIGLYFLLNDLGLFDKKIKLNWLTHTFLVGLGAFLLGLPFIIVSHNYTFGLNQSFVEAARDRGIHNSYLHKLGLYWQLLPQQMSLMLYCLFLVAVFFTSLQRHISLAPITVSAIGGFALTCTSIWTDLVLDGRYTAPCLLAAAIYSGLFLDKLFAFPNWWKRTLASTVILFATLNYVFYNFVPYPLPLPVLPYQPIRSNNPVAFEDWGHDLVLRTIAEKDNNKAVYLNILSNSIMFHPHVFQLLLKEKDNKTIMPTSSRSWTIVGDKVQFNPTTALYYQWYLLKTDSPGYYFYDKESQANFNRLVNFVCYSGKYNLVATKILPDGHELKLYRCESN